MAIMRVSPILLFLLVLTPSASAETAVTLLHFSDYHSHALPFYTEEGERGGIARAIGYLAREKKNGALVFSGGDTINIGAPAWSDKYRGAEWPWWNGIVDAMAFGNHDADYGREVFDACRKSIRYPLLSANTGGFQRYAIFKVNGIRIGVFALAGPDFKTLVKTEGFVFEPALDAARAAVLDLREKENVDAVVMIGHEHTDDDEALARAVPGIDLIFGTHSHLKRELGQLPGTQTWFIAPWQYLGYISRVQLTFDNRKLTRVTGALVPVDARLREDRVIRKRVARMQRMLERDPQYASLFTSIARLAAPIGIEALANRTLETMRRVTNADVALSTKSSFRRPLPAGTLNLELLRGALPYDNEIVVCEMPREQWQRVVEAAGGDSFISGTAPTDRKVRVATTDYAANAAHRNVFQCEKKNSGLRVREELRKTF
jgi:5'-nucleotidase / UDP-sugar diphosphatase